ncbi:IS21 family transposase, partial [Bacillus infantis]
MINYRKILVMGLDGISQRTISSSTGHSRNTVAEVLQHANQKGIKNLEEAMNNEWLETYLFPEKQAVEKGYCPVDFEWVHKE